ncbi:hypothetical protein Avbf_04675 [Armadillidium vulgare]|nr:hypothetical protein Avbf_04675 [Armadillidium vulgare]
MTSQIQATPSELALRHYYHPYNPSDVPRPTRSSLRLETIAKHYHFKDGMITLLCRAEVKGLHESRVLHRAREASKLKPSLLEGYNEGKIQSFI